MARQLLRIIYFLAIWFVVPAFFFIILFSPFEISLSPDESSSSVVEDWDQIVIEKVIIREMCNSQTMKKFELLIYLNR